MNVKIGVMVVGIVLLLNTGCMGAGADRYNTQRGALIGAGVGAIAGQAIGNNTGGTLIGAVVGAGAGALIGNAKDQDHQAHRDQAHRDSVATVHMEQNNARTDCRKVLVRKIVDGKVVSENIEEICESRRITQTY